MRVVGDALVTRDGDHSGGVGSRVGPGEGAFAGATDGPNELKTSSFDGARVGCADGLCEGRMLRSRVGSIVGCNCNEGVPVVGDALGTSDGNQLGSSEGVVLGGPEATNVGGLDG